MDRVPVCSLCSYIIILPDRRSMIGIFFEGYRGVETLGRRLVIGYISISHIVKNSNLLDIKLFASLPVPLSSTGLNSDPSVILLS